jgi:hypothetical protein
MSLLAHSIVAPFSQISLCLNCDHVSDPLGDQCPKCGLKGLMNLKKAFVAFRHQHIFDSEYGVARGKKSAFLACRCGEHLQIQLAEGSIQ